MDEQLPDDYQMGDDVLRLELVIAIMAEDDRRYQELTAGVDAPAWEQVQRMLEVGMRPQRIASKIASKPRQTRVPPTPGGRPFYRASNP